MRELWGKPRRPNSDEPAPPVRADNLWPEPLVEVMMHYPRLAWGLAAALTFGAAAAGYRSLAQRPETQAAEPSRPAAPVLASVLIRDVPHVRQKPDFCGEACAAMALNRLGISVDQDWVFDQSGLDPAEGRGCYTKELAAALKSIGFRVGPVWHQVSSARRSEELASLFAALHADLAAGVPSIVCMYYDRQPGTTEHFRLVLGYDAKTDEVIYHEPAEDRGSYQRMKRAEFLSLWPLKWSGENFSAIRLRLEPGELRRGRASTAPTSADYAQHVMQLKKRLPEGLNYSVVIQPPFVVIGDDPPADIRRYAQRTVKWAVDHLKAAYFPKDPEEIIDVWLFKDKESYEKHCQSIFNTKPTTPYGFYSHRDRALVMNIATGGGTLVHEIVHAFVAPNFPDCPAWFNEGLGSLYEQCGEQDGAIHGYTNWRLAGLQEAIRKGRTVPFRELCSTGTREFYESDRGANYAQARYLCYYLQQQGLLQKYYKAFLANCREDPSGYETLKRTLGRDDEGMKAFQREWESYVLKLRFP